MNIDISKLYEFLSYNKSSRSEYLLESVEIGLSFVKQSYLFIRGRGQKIFFYAPSYFCSSGHADA